MNCSYAPAHTQLIITWTASLLILLLQLDTSLGHMMYLLGSGNDNLCVLLCNRMFCSQTHTDAWYISSHVRMTCFAFGVAMGPYTCAIA